MAQQPDLQQCGTVASGSVLYYYDGVSIIDGVDQWVDRVVGEGTGVVSGMAVTAGSGLTLSVASGVVQVRSIQYSYSGGSINVATGSNHDRRDLLVARIASSAVTLALYQGTPWSPLSGDSDPWTRNSFGDGPAKAQPLIVSTTDCPLVEIYVPMSMGTIAAGFPSAGQGQLVSKTAVPARPPSGATANTPGSSQSLSQTSGQGFNVNAPLGGPSTQILAANNARLMFDITNTSQQERVSISFGGQATDGVGIVLQPLQTSGPLYNFTGYVNVCCSNTVTGTGTVSFVEV